jgi:hypothetical protein
VEGCPDQFMLYLGGPFPEYNKVLINVNERTFESMNFLDHIPEEFAISISFKDTDVFTGGDEY